VYASIFALIASLCAASACCGDLPKRYPHNLFICAGIAVVAGLFLGVMAVALGVTPDDSRQVWIAFGTTCAVMVSLGLFAMQTRVDFSGIGPYLTISVLLLFMFAFMGGFMTNVGGLLYVLAGLPSVSLTLASRAARWIALIVVLMSLYVVYDMQLVMGGKHRRYQFSVDDAPLASLSLFTVRRSSVRWQLTRQRRGRTLS